MKPKAKVANVIANASNFLVHWRPFNTQLVNKAYKWAHKIRSNDPAWSEYLAAQKAAEQGGDGAKATA